MTINCAIDYQPTQARARALELCRQLGLPLWEDNNNAPWRLELTADGLQLTKSNTRAHPLRIDFPRAHQLQQHGGGKKSYLLARACGLTKGLRQPTILDLTAGLAQDAFRLAVWGAHVTMLEGAPLIAALIEDALARAQPWLIEQHIHLCLITGEATNYLQTQPPPVDIVFIDPMFPKKQKCAAVKQSMQWLEAFAIAPDDPSELLTLALQTATVRVVVKRHRHSPLFDQRTPHCQYLGRSTRFDVYLPKHSP